MPQNIEEVYREKLINAIETIKKLKEEVEIQKSAQKSLEPIAIVGIGCRYPGEIRDTESFWNLLKNKQDASSDMPSSRWDINKLYSQDRTEEGKMYTKRGSFISNLDQFDNHFFNISNREALIMDPQQRLLLDVTYEALENAGIDLFNLNGTNTSVYIGCTSDGYEQRHIKSFDTSKIDPYSITGYFKTALSGRISYLLGLHGPNVAIDTGCSASLVAIHLACQSLKLHESNLAIAGGVNTLLSPEHFIALSTMNALSVDGRCRTFDASSDGFGRGDGCGVLVLKRLSDAERDKDKIWGLIKGTAINQDGKSNGFTAPNMKAQVEVIQTALAQAGLSPEDIDFVEAHGTGTPIGDPIEIEGIQNAYSRKKTTPLYVGAVKSNFGHTEGAAGVAGVIKSILAINHKKIPANLHFENPSPYIEWDESNIVIPTELTDWEKNGSLRAAGISSFGISGTNAHVIVQEYPEKENKPSIEPKAHAIFLLPISARSPKALAAQAQQMRKFLEGKEEEELDLICRNAVYRRTHYEYRAVAVGQNKATLLDQLDAIVTQFSDGEGAACLQTEDCKLVFVFPGQGAQWVGMAQDLYRTDECFRAVLNECDQIIQSEWAWSLIEEIHKDAEGSNFNQIEIIQPILCVLEIALAETWIRHKVIPQAVIGHSMGEIAAAYISGILSLEEALKVICTRSSLMKRKKGLGAMALVELGLTEIESYLRSFSGEVSVAVVNGPHSTVISGNTEAVNTLISTFEKKDIFARLINVDVASHSPQMDDLRADLLDQLSVLEPSNAKIPFYSTVLSKKINGTECDESYWLSNLRNSVKFASTVEMLLDSGFNIFLEITPHPILTHALEQIIAHKKATAFAFPSLLRNKSESLQFAMSWANLHRLAYPVDWSIYYDPKPSNFVLPSYPWQQKSFWLPLPESGTQSTASNFDVPTSEPNLQSSIIDSILECRETEQQYEIVREFLKTTIARVLKLSIEEIPLQTEFKKIGMDSLMLMQMRLPVEKQFRSKISIKTLLQHNTVEKLGQYLHSIALDSAPAQEEYEPQTVSLLKDRAFMYGEAVLDDSIHTANSLPMKPEGDVLVTGATGFIGAFFVAELLENTKSLVHCLVRAKDDEHAKQRLVEALQGYGCYKEEYGERLHAFAGDLTMPQLGLKANEYDHLSNCINKIFHFAAWVTWLYTYEDVKSENVSSVHEILKFAINGHLKHIHYTSTIGTFSSLMPKLATNKVDEDELMQHPECLVGSYSQTKWVVDQMMDIATQRGLIINRYRIGDIKGHSQTGSANLSDFMNSFMKVCIEIGAMPEIGMEFNLIPVDFLCRAMRTLSEMNVGKNCNYQFNNDKILHAKEFIAHLRSLDFDLKLIPRENWLALMADAHASKLDPAYQTVAVVFKPLLKENDKEICYIDAIPNVYFSDEKARKHLDGRGVQFPDTYRDALLKHYLDYFISVGYLNLRSKK